MGRAYPTSPLHVVLGLRGTAGASWGFGCVDGAICLASPRKTVFRKGAAAGGLAGMPACCGGAWKATQCRNWGLTTGPEYSPASSRPHRGHRVPAGSPGAGHRDALFSAWPLGCGAPEPRWPGTEGSLSAHSLSHTPPAPAATTHHGRGLRASLARRLPRRTEGPQGEPTRMAVLFPGAQLQAQALPEQACLKQMPRRAQGQPSL